MSHRDPAADLFCAASLQITRTPYMLERADMVQLMKLRKVFGIGTLETPPDWEQAIVNFFGSPRSPWTLAKLATPKFYAVYRNSRVDQYGNAVNHVNGGPDGGRSKEQARIERNREGSRRVLDELHGRVRPGVGSGSAGRAKSDLPTLFETKKS